MRESGKELSRSATLESINSGRSSGLLPGRHLGNHLAERELSSDVRFSGVGQTGDEIGICTLVFHARLTLSYSFGTVVLAKSDLIDKLGVVVFPSISLRAPIVRSLDRVFRFPPEPRGAPTRDPRAPPSTRRPQALRQGACAAKAGAVRFPPFDVLTHRAVLHRHRPFAEDAGGDRREAHGSIKQGERERPRLRAQPGHERNGSGSTEAGAAESGLAEPTGRRPAWRLRGPRPLTSARSLCCRSKTSPVIQAKIISLTEPRNSQEDNEATARDRPGVGCRCDRGRLSAALWRPRSSYGPVDPGSH
jgi:hypothetical protein